MFVKPLRHSFVRADNDNSQYRQLFNFDEFLAITKMVRHSVKLGRAGGASFMTSQDASILYISDYRDRHACLLTLLKIRQSEGSPYKYLLCSNRTNEHFESMDFHKILKRTQEILALSASPDAKIRSLTLGG